MVWCGMVWCGVVWCGMVEWCGVWCGVVWCGVVVCGVVGTVAQLDFHILSERGNRLGAFRLVSVLKNKLGDAVVEVCLPQFFSFLRSSFRSVCSPPSPPSLPPSRRGFCHRCTARLFLCSYAFVLPPFCPVDFFFFFSSAFGLSRHSLSRRKLWPTRTRARSTSDGRSAKANPSAYPQTVSVSGRCAIFRLCVWAICFSSSSCCLFLSSPSL